MRKTRLLILSALVFDVLLLTSCTASWVTEAQGIITVLGGAALNVLAVVAALSGKTVTPAAATAVETVFTKITDGLNLVGQLISEYTPANSAGTLGEIAIALDEIKANLSQILPLLNVTDPATVAKITELLDLFMAEVDSLAKLVPVISGKPNVATLREAVGNSKLLSAKDFEKVFHEALQKRSGDPVVDEAVDAALKPEEE